MSPVSPVSPASPDSFMTPQSSSAGPRTLSIGGATFDLFVNVGAEAVEHLGVHALHLPLGAKMRVQNVVGACGGGACNTAVGLARLGCDSGFAGMLASDQWGDILQKNLQKEGVRTDTATILDDETSSFSIILSAKTGERVILYDPGANAHMHDATFDKQTAATVDWIFLNHLHERACIIEDDIVELLGSGSPPGLSWNPGGCQIEGGMKAKTVAKLVARTNFLQMNKEEALAFTGKSTVREAILALVEAGVNIVCVTDGKNGVMASDGKRLYSCKALQAPVVDTTGAGDAFGTGCTWALLQGLDLPTILKAGTINATSVIGRLGAQAGLLTHTEMLRRLQDTALPVESESL